MTFILGFLIGFVASLLLSRYANKKYSEFISPYRWVCPVEDCCFSITSSHMQVLDSFATDHRRKSHAQ